MESETLGAAASLAEEWRPIIGYEGRNEVSDQGRVRSLVGSVASSAVLIASTTPKGYQIVGLWSGMRPSKQHTYTVHNLVLKAFVGAKPVGHQVDHSDRNKKNNSLANLRYVTRCQNAQNAHRGKRGGCVYVSKYRGVSRRSNGMYRAEIRANGTRVTIGMFSEETDAAKAYDRMARELHGSFAILNFPEAYQ